MIIQDLRQLLANHEAAWWQAARRFFQGERPEVIAIRNFLRLRADKAPDYPFTPEEYIELIRTAVSPSDSDFIGSLRERLHISNEFETFRVLFTNGLITVNNITAIQALREHKRAFFRLYFQVMGKQYPFDAVVFNAVLNLFNLSRVTSTQQSLEDCIDSLHFNNIVVTQYVPMLTYLIQQNQLGNFRIIIQALQRADSVNQRSLQKLRMHTPKIPAVALLSDILTEAGLRLHSDLLSNALESQNLPSVLAIAKPLATANLLDLSLLGKLLYYPANSITNLGAVIPPLQSIGLLSKTSLHYLIHNNAYCLIKILKSLAASHPTPTTTLLETNVALVARLINGELDTKKFYYAVEFLSRSNSLTQNIINLCIPKLERSRTSNAIDVFDIFDKLYSINTIVLSTKVIEYLFSLTQTKIDLLFQLIDELKAKKLLNSKNLDVLLEKFAAKCPTVTSSPVSKQSRKETHASRSLLTINETAVFLEHNKGHYPGGTYGLIKQGFCDASTNQPRYSIKKMRPERSDEKQATLARREAKHARLLGRTAYYFTRAHKHFVMSEWQHGKPLNAYSHNELTATPIKQRLLCLMRGLQNLNQFHECLRVHNDVKCSNWILDLNALCLRLIDFGSAHKIGSPKKYALTDAYWDRSHEDRIAKDLFSMSICVAKLFPEIYTVQKAGGYSIIEFKKTQLSLVDNAITQLIKAMRNPYNTRCTSADAIAFCQQIITDYDRLTPELVKTITENTILRANTTFDDILRGRF